jgi:OOP family OmpA-OmpF porin
VDRCPNTRRGVTVDALGCEALFPDGRVMVLRGVTFDGASSALTRESYAVLDGIAAALLAHSEIRVEVAGYTDDVGTAAARLRLSQLRAEAVRGYFVGRGVAASRLTARGFGAANPVASNATAAGRAQNRRIELHRLP